MTVFKDSLADPLGQTLAIEAEKPTKQLVVPNVDPVPADQPNGALFYDTSDDKLKVILNGITKEIATV